MEQSAGSGSKRDDDAVASRAALLTAARSRFARDGYRASSIDDIAADARLTKGAVYHHFGSKVALFEQVFREVHHEIADSLWVATQEVADDDPLGRARASLGAFLDALENPDVRRLAVEEAPIALGVAQHRAIDEEILGAELETRLAAFADAGILADGIDATTARRVLHGALKEASPLLAEAGTDADAVAAARSRFERVMEAVIAGLLQR